MSKSKKVYESNIIHRSNSRKAKVTITLIDEGGDKLTVGIESDPPFPGPAAEDQTMTPAQMTAMKLLQCLSPE